MGRFPFYPERYTLPEDRQEGCFTYGGTYGRHKGSPMFADGAKCQTLDLAERGLAAVATDETVPVGTLVWGIDNRTLKQYEFRGFSVYASPAVGEVGREGWALSNMRRYFLTPRAAAEAYARGAAAAVADTLGSLSQVFLQVDDVEANQTPSPPPQCLFSQRPAALAPDQVEHVLTVARRNAIYDNAKRLGALVCRPDLRDADPVLSWGHFPGQPFTLRRDLAGRLWILDPQGRAASTGFGLAEREKAVA